MARHIITAVIVFSNIIGGLLEDILIADGHSLDYRSLCSSRHIALNGSSLRDVAALAYDPVGGRVIISEAGAEAGPQLLTIPLVDAAVPQRLPLKGAAPGLLEGLVVSARLSAVFATDSSNRSVVRLPLLSGNTSEEGASSEVLHLLPGDRPRGIALLDTEGLVFWTNWRYGRQSIERSRLDGDTRKQLISSDLYLPNGVAADPASSRLYFLDTDTEGRIRVETTSVEGKERRVVYSGRHPRARGLQLAGRYLYWWDTRGVWRLPVAGGEAALIVPRRSRPDAVLVLREDEDCTSYSDEVPVEVVVTHSPVSSAACRDFCLRGTCVQNELENRTCVCPAGFSGLRCEISVCTNYCLSGGVCEVDSSGVARCSCPQGWTGPRCCRQQQQQQSQSDSAAADTLPSPLAGAQQRQEADEAVADVSADGVSPPLVAEPSGRADGISCGTSMVFGLSASSLRLLLVSLLLMVVTLVTMLSMLAIRLRRSRAACRSPAAYVAASAPRRIVADKRLLPRPTRPAPDIEDCCMMTLCETPCVQSSGRPSSRRSGGVDSTCERRALVQPETGSCEKQALADLF